MTFALVAVAALVLGVAAGFYWARHPFSPQTDRLPEAKTILLPFSGASISKRSFEAAVRLAKAEDAVIMPALLAQVPMTLPLDSPLPASCLRTMPLLEAIEQNATRLGVRVDARVSRGRTAIDALRRLLASEDFDRIVVSADNSPRHGLTSLDVDWLLRKAPAEVLVLRPGPEDHREITAGAEGASGKASPAS
jgi:hypothetical protein